MYWVFAASDLERSREIELTKVVITRCAYAQGRVKRLSLSIYVCVKKTCVTARKSPRSKHVWRFCLFDARV